MTLRRVSSSAFFEAVVLSRPNETCIAYNEATKTWFVVVPQSVVRDKNPQVLVRENGVVYKRTVDVNYVVLEPTAFFIEERFQPYSLERLILQLPLRVGTTTLLPRKEQLTASIIGTRISLYGIFYHLGIGEYYWMEDNQTLEQNDIVAFDDWRLGLTETLKYLYTPWVDNTRITEVGTTAENHDEIMELMRRAGYPHLSSANSNDGIFDPRLFSSHTVNPSKKTHNRIKAKAAKKARKQTRKTKH